MSFLVFLSVIQPFRKLRVASRELVVLFLFLSDFLHSLSASSQISSSFCRYIFPPVCFVLISFLSYFLLMFFLQSLLFVILLVLVLLVCLLPINSLKSVCFQFLCLPISLLSCCSPLRHCPQTSLLSVSVVLQSAGRLREFVSLRQRVILV